ncbi:general substrate transporter [Rhizodiscina lignyota]|uniref:General substrate transporter n=1 Tax=Rhizodiscina lignyota TaxID=1504668 RepID=A0A9P4HZW8_9PEZI|nr:general substrate transporter [Rhizodiscina lignyota]
MGLLTSDRIRFINVAITVFVSLGSFTYGYCSSIIATTLGQPQFYEYLHLAQTGPGLSHTNDITGAMNGLFQGGGVFGSLAVGPIADKFSRRGSIAIAASICLLGGALQCGAVNVGMFLAARFITGFGTGMILCSVPLYQSELAPPHSRGVLVGIHGVWICCGYSTAGWVGYGCFYYTTAFQWRFPLAVQCFAPIMLLIGLFFLPESPRWLALQDRPDAAYKVIKYLHNDPNDPQQILAKEEYYAMQKQIELDKSKGTGSYYELFTVPANRKRVLLGFMTLFGAQCTATIVINNYGIILYTALGYQAPTTLAFTAGWVTVCIGGNAVTALFVDRVGRVRFLLIGFAGCLLALIMEMWLLAVYEHSSNKSGQAAAVAFLFIHVGFFSVCIDATTYIYCTEIFPNYLRSRGSSMSVSGLFFATVIFTCAAPAGFGAIGWKYYLVFAILTFFMIIGIWFYWPETKGLSLDEINALFGDDVAIDISHLTEEDRKALDQQILSEKSQVEKVEDMDAV